MAIAATIEWEVRTTGTASNANGGGYKPGASGTDYSQQDAAQYNLTGVTTAAADAILLSASAAADMVGNLAHIVSGTNFTVGWYEIVSVVAGVSITLDRTCTSAAGAAGVVNIGGALSLGHTTDDAVFESMEPGNIMHIKSGTYTLGSAISMAKDGTGALPIAVRGYQTARNDSPISTGRPTLAFGANSSLFGDNVHINCVIFTTTSATGVDTGAADVISRCKSTNSSLTAGRSAFRMTTASMLLSSEAASDAGEAVELNVSTGTRGIRIVGCYLHDSDTGVHLNALDENVVLHNIIDTVVTGINTGSGSNQNTIAGNTIYGAATPAGTSRGIYFVATTGTNNLVENNIISGFVTGIDSAAVVTSNIFRYNALHNNTTNYVNVTAGEGSITSDPAFVDAPNGNFAVGANMKAAGSPGVFPGGLSTGYLDIGAVQRVEPVGGGSSGGARVIGAGIVSGG